LSEFGEPGHGIPPSDHASTRVGSFDPEDLVWTSRDHVGIERIVEPAVPLDDLTVPLSRAEMAVP
jgi:hypothetical protein